MNFNHGYLSISRGKGVPVLFHWTLLLWLPVSLAQDASLGRLALSFPAFVFLMVAHEAGHAMMARRRHVKVRAIRLYMFHGLCEYDLPYFEIDHILVAWGGVLAQAVVWLISLLLLVFLSYVAPRLAEFLQPMLAVFLPINLFIMILNLIPIKPLDGYLAWRIMPFVWNALLFRTMPRIRHKMNLNSIEKQRAIDSKSKIAAEELLDRLKNK